MTLAVLLLIGTLLPQSATQAGTPQGSPPTTPGNAAGAQEQTKQPASTEAQPSVKQPDHQRSGKTRLTLKRTHKKKSASADCNSPEAQPSSGLTSNSSSQAAANSSAATDPRNATATAPTKCPPPRIIVRQGGTTDPSIQLAGGPTADEANRKKDAINQLLGTTDQNLKKTTGRELTSVQQDTVTQTRQFMEQSKQAIADGDLERARTLAWKAEVLSEDLVKPEK